MNGHAPGRGTAADSVLLLRTDVGGGELACSGALVAPNLVVTARHCVSYFTEGNFACNVRGELLDESTEGGRLGLHFPPDSVELYAGDGAERELVAKGLEIYSTLSDTVCLDDLAYVVLDRELDVRPLPLRLDASAKVGEKVSLMGFGLDGKMSFDTPIDDLVLHVNDALEIDDIGPSKVEDVTTAPPRTLIVEGPAGCVGDSGAPLIDSATSEVLGVYSLLLADSCLADDARGFFPYVREYTALTSEAFDAAGAVPLSVGSGGNGDPGAAGRAGDDGVEPAAGGQAGEPASSGGQGGSAGSAAGAPASPAPRARKADRGGCSLSRREASGASVACWLALAFLYRRRISGDRRGDRLRARATRSDSDVASVA